MVASIRSGHTAGYLLNEVGKGRENYYTGAVTEGEPPGRWWGAGAEAYGLTGEVDPDVMTALYTDHRDPRDPRFDIPGQRDQAATLGRAPMHYQDAGPGTRQAVAFHDVTFSPAKSVTVLHTAYERMELDARRAGDEVGAEGWAAKRAAVEDAVWAGNQAMLSHLEKVGSYARVGQHTRTSGRWIDGNGLAVASFFQHTSRANDPQLHIHNAAHNRIVCSDGKVRTLDAKLLYQAKQGAGTLADRVVMEHLTRELGAGWTMRADGIGFEIDGVDQATMDLFSSRTTKITRSLDAKVSEFRERFGREPSSLELSRLSKRATLETRPRKSHDGETREQALDRWDRQLRAEVGHALNRVAESVGQRRSVADRVADEWSPDGVVEQALAAAQDKRAVFGRSELQREVILALPPVLGTRTDAETVEVVERLTDLAVSRAVQVAGETDQEAMPDGLTLADGTSAYAKPGGARYATTGHLVSEQALRRASVERGRMAVTATDAEQWLTMNENGQGWSLGADQAAAVRGLVTSGAAVSVLVGPAGAGKSRTLGALSDAWSDLTGGRVHGLATSQRATEVLTDDGVTAMNTAMWLETQTRLHGGTPDARNEPWRLSPIDVVVIDEASMVDTKVIQKIRGYVDQAGARLVLAGDPRQLAAVGAGGGMALVTDRADTHHLTEVRRFSNPWEAQASLALRAGDEAAVEEYDRRGRVLAGGTAVQAGHQAARAYVGDVLAGKSTVIVTATNGEAATVAAHVREHLAELGKVGPAEVILGRDRNEAGAGDLVQARHNDYRIGVINRGRYVVDQVREDGSMVVRAEDGGETHTLPAEYVAEHVTLGYAGTVHAVEGITVQRSHGVVSPQWDSAALLVALTRGSESNTAHVATRAEVADAPTGETAGNEPRPPTDVLRGILAAERETTAAALDVAEQEAVKAASMATILARQEASSRAFGELRTKQWLDRLATEGALSEADRASFSADQGTVQLSRLLRAVEQAGDDPQETLRAAIADRSLDGSKSVAQVVHYRIASTHDLTPQLEQGAVIPADAPEEWRAHLQYLADRADNRRRELGTQVADDPPRWALDALGPVPDDVVERAEWEHKAGAVQAHREATGHDDDTQPLPIAPGLHATERRASWHEGWAALGRPAATVEEHSLSEGALRNRQAAWEREREAAPPPIFEQQRVLGVEIARHEQDAAILASRADTAADQVEAERLRRDAEDRAVLADVMRERAAELEQVRDVQAQWYVDTAVTRELGERAEQELAARGTPMGDEPDRTTAEAWLAAEREARIEDDPHREVHEVDVAEPERDAVDGWGQTAQDVDDDDAEQDRQESPTVDVQAEQAANLQLATQVEATEPEPVDERLAEPEKSAEIGNHLPISQPERVEPVAEPVDERPVAAKPEPVAEAVEEPEPATEPEGVPAAREVDAAVAVARLAAERMADRASAEQATRAAEDSARAEAAQASREQAWRDQDAEAAQRAAEAATEDQYAAM